MQEIPDVVRTLERDLEQVFGDRLESLVLLPRAAVDNHGMRPSLAVVRTLTAADLSACAEHVASWHDAGLATPLVMPSGEFKRSIDAFPLEFAAMVHAHTLVRGRAPFDGVHVDPEDLRRACERQIRSHLLHLREGFLEARGRGDRIAALIIRSAAPLAALISSVARLQNAAAEDIVATAARVEAVSNCAPGSLTDVVRLTSNSSLTPDSARQMFPAYVDAVGALANAVDRWNAR
jgi:hypothetical protein